MFVTPGWPPRRIAGAAKGQKGIAVEDLVRRAIAGIAAGETENPPGSRHALKTAGRVEPGVIFRQISQVGR